MENFIVFAELETAYKEISTFRSPLKNIFDNQ